MRVAVVSSDTFTEADLPLLDEVCLSSRYCCTEVVTFSRGLGGPWARQRRLPVTWVSAANQIPQRAEAVVVLWDGKSADIAALIRVARGWGLLVYARVAAPRGSAET